MGFLWWGRKSSDEKVISENEDTLVNVELDEFLNAKESQLSNREFKELIRRQSKNDENTKADEENNKNATAPDFLQMLQAKAPDVVADGTGVLPPTPISTTTNMRKPKSYVNFEFESYRRDNDEKECVLTNCSEIQSAFYECLGTQGIWDRLGAVSRLDSDRCTKLADFFMACTEVQKKAFLMFDYSALESIEEMKEASRKIDVVFTGNFKNVDDVQDKEKFLKYTRDLRKERELFFEKFGK